MDDGEIARKIEQIFDLRPSAIVKRLGLKNPIFRSTAAYGHMGRKPETKEVVFLTNGKTEKRSVEFFAWEKLDYVDILQKEFNI
jgi:S-adenosylmethionine synthetase